MDEVYGSDSCIFDVGFIIMVPVIYALSRRTGKSLLLGLLIYIIELIGHPFSVLIITNLIAWYFWGLKER